MGTPNDSPIRIILGSKNDRPVVDDSGMLDILQKLGVRWSLSYISAHRNKQSLADYCREAIENGVKVFITAAGMMPALPGDVAGWTDALCLVIGVVLDSSTIPGRDTIATATAMPNGTPVAFAGIGKHGLKNAAILAVQALACGDPSLKEALRKYREKNNPEPQPDVETSESYPTKSGF